MWLTLDFDHPKTNLSEVPSTLILWDQSSISIFQGQTTTLSTLLCLINYLTLHLLVGGLVKGPNGSVFPYRLEPLTPPGVVTSAAHAVINSLLTTTQACFLLVTTGLSTSISIAVVSSGSNHLCSLMLVALTARPLSSHFPVPGSSTAHLNYRGNMVLQNGDILPQHYLAS